MMYKTKNTMKHFEEKDGIKRKIYYHYTSLDSLYKIISSKTFRLMSLSSTNDKTELTYSQNDFLNDFKAVSKELTMTIDFPFDSINEYNKQYGISKKAGSHSYALSLSDRRDNLTHWERYADNCKGVCIAINTSALEIYCKRKNKAIYASNFFDVGGTLYTEKERKEKIKQLWSVYYSLFDNDKIKISNSGLYLAYSLIYLQLKKFVKNPHFIDESEIRIHYNEETINSMNKLFQLDPRTFDAFRAECKMFIDEIGIEERKYTVTSKGIRSYHNLCLSEIWGNGLIPEIYLGPLCVQNINELKLFLKDNGLGSCKVTKSNVPIN